MKQYYKVSEIRRGHFRIFDRMGVHMELLVGTEKALLLDTGYGFGDLPVLIRNITSLPLYVVNSHGHVDHTCGNYQFDGPIYIHPDDISVCQNHHSKRQKELAINYAETVMGFVPFDNAADKEEYCQQWTGHLCPIREGQVFSLGGMDLQVVEIPGHTPGSIGLMDSLNREFYVGDAMNNCLWLFLPDAGTLSQYRRTLRKTLELDFDTLILSHTAEPLGKAVLLDYLDIAENLDYSKGEDYSSPMFPEAHARLCIREGYTVQSMERGEPGFASIAIDEIHDR